ncbi:hypothetical protein [Paludisphaera rhizosphaerae]|uniref:hypothetical protein n=1 Tax=Paludisphaera rhizosphaerae TaxID=2711216 RepID=UPI0013EC55E3|nr:hypothetical protein [Paludisphaera rhizosphaerae]
MMIPTTYRAKLPRGLSFPIGAEAVSQALVGTPRFEALSLTFWDQAVWPASKFRRLLEERSPYKVMTAEFHPARKPGVSAAEYMIQSGWYDEKWELFAYPVLAEFRHPANRLLRETGLPAVASWLKSSDRAGWTATWRRIELIFNPVDESLTPQTSHGV